MKKRILLLPVALVLLATFTSCVSTKKGYQSSPVMIRNVELDPIKADIYVDERSKISGESSAGYLFFLFRISGDRAFADGINYSTEASGGFLSKINPFKSGRINRVRSAAAYKALGTGNYDLLVHPNYTTTVRNYLVYKKIISKVDGYGAKYLNFHTEKQKIVILESGKEVILQGK